MKILNINSYYYSSTVHSQLQSSLSKQGTDIFTYVPVVRGYIAREECKADKNKNIKKVECYSKIDRYIFHIKHKKIFNNIIKEVDFNEYECLHAHSLFSNGYIAMKLKERYGLPYVVAVRDTDLNIFFKKMIHLRRLGNKILERADAIIFLSKTYKDELINNYVNDKCREAILRKSYILPNGINEFWLLNIGKNREYEIKRKINLLYIGVIAKRKNVLGTIEAIKILRQQGYNVELTIVGKITNKKIYEKISMYNFVRYELPKPKEELLQIYAQNDIFVMPSITETFGLVYPEAMSQGLPVIYTKGQGFDEQFEEGRVGYHVECFDYEEIANSIIKITKNYENISKECLKCCHQFSWDRISLKYNEIYSNILNNKLKERNNVKLPR